LKLHSKKNAIVSIFELKYERDSGGKRDWKEVCVSGCYSRIFRPFLSRNTHHLITKTLSSIPEITAKESQRLHQTFLCFSAQTQNASGRTLRVKCTGYQFIIVVVSLCCFIDITIFHRIIFKSFLFVEIRLFMFRLS